MRFLQVTLNGTLTLTKDLITPPGPYAILSHTWGADDDEVTFYDLEHQTGTGKTGYTKLWFCINQAKIDGLKYCWVDTCCINKANLVELDEAIRSMFAWYRNAATCYVYLSDVPLRNKDNTKDRTWESAFHKSRWFTRGWTLQELLAPTSVQFFSRENERLGTKTSLEQQIHDITQIPVTALRGTPLSQFSVEERLQWALNRETRKIEDKAYCLLGIFGVFMSLRYGEGDNAFSRLMRRIACQASDTKRGLDRSNFNIGVEHTTPGYEHEQWLERSLNSQTVRKNKDVAESVFPLTEFHDSAYQSVFETKSSNSNRPTYSIASSVEMRFDSLEQAFAKDLYEQLVTSKNRPIPGDSLELVQDVLPGLLERFALRISTEIRSRAAQEVTFYVHKHSSDITHLLLNSRGADDADNEDARKAYNKDPGMSLADKMSSWLPSLDDAEKPGHQRLGIFEDEAHPTNTADRWADECRDLISSSSSYGWLVTEIRTALNQTRMNGEIRSQVQHSILECLPFSDRVSPKRLVKSETAIFELFWDLQELKDLQNYLEDLPDILERAITLTGDPCYAQALPCATYVGQTWPETGRPVLEALQYLLQKDSKGSYKNNTELEASQNGAATSVRVIGNRFTIADIGEQLAWMYTALYPSPFTGIASATPWVRVIPSMSSTNLGDVVNMEIGCSIEELDSLGTDPVNSAAGLCWYDMFRNPTLVRGFPILKRSLTDSGIEMPVNMIAALLQAPRLEAYDGVTYFKGFSSMLYPTRIHEGQIVWHHDFNTDGSHMFYPGNRPAHKVVLDASDIARSRNIIGWSLHAHNLTGRPGAEYDIKRSGLRSKGSTCILKQVTLNVGKIATVGLSCAIGEKDRPLHISADQYRNRIMAASMNYFVLWDSKDKRGWFANGADVLLHLVRASLWYNEHETSWNRPLTSWNGFHESCGTSNRQYSAEILSHRDNMLKRIWKGKYETEAEEVTSRPGQSEITSTTSKGNVKVNYFRLQDLVEEKWAAMEKMISRQHEAGLDLARLKQKRLEGWDFHDFVTNTSIIEARTDGLGDSGANWIEFVQAMHANVLMGRGFGELIQSSQPRSSGCHCWPRVPTNNHYLTAHMTDLRWIRDRYGPDDNPREIFEDIVWENPSGRTNICHCNPEADVRSVPAVDCLQVLKRRSALDFTRRRIQSCHVLDNASPSNSNGAIIFGDWKASPGSRQADVSYADPMSGISANMDGDPLQPTTSSGTGSRSPLSVFSRTPGDRRAQPDSITSYASTSRGQAADVAEQGSNPEEPNLPPARDARPAAGRLGAFRKGNKRKAEDESGDGNNSRWLPHGRRRRNGTM